VLVLAGTGLACSPDGYRIVAQPTGTDAAPTRAEPAPDEDPGEALPEPGPARPLPDGVYLVQFLQLDSNQVTADPEGWFSGAHANRESALRGEGDPPNGFLLVNERPSRDVFPLTPDVPVTSSLVSHPWNHEVTHGPVDLATLVEAWKFRDADGGRGTFSDHFRVTLAGGRVTRIDEQYVP
ncbi:MAG: hypothetical protein ACRD0S_12395, partial [Acidimicrobiales bacterium]